MEFLNAIFEIILSIFSGTFEAVTDFIVELCNGKHETTYNAEFGAIGDQLQKEGGGLRIGYDWGTDLLSSHSHMIIFGGSGSKKSASVAYPTLLQSHEGSFVVFDIAKELVKTAPYLSENGYAIFCLDLDDFTNSIGFNRLDTCTKESEVAQSVHVLMANSKGDAPNDYWMQSATNLASFCAYALFLYAPKEYVNFPNVLNMLQIFSFDASRIDAWVAKTGDEGLIKRYKSIISTPEKTLLSSVSTALHAFEIFNDPSIAAISSKDTLPFDTFRQQKTALFICGSVQTMHYAKSITATYLESFFSHILSKPPDQNTGLPITFILDECASVMCPMLPKVLELGRKCRISLATFWQDYNQIEQIYNKHQAANILANSRYKVYMPSGQPLPTCKMLEELLGRYSYESEHGIKSRELLTAQEIFQLDKLLVLNGNNKPLLLPPKPYFANKKLLALLDMPPITLSAMEPLCVPPLLTFEQP